MPPQIGVTQKPKADDDIVDDDAAPPLSHILSYRAGACRTLKQKKEKVKIKRWQPVGWANWSEWSQWSQPPQQLKSLRLRSDMAGKLIASQFKNLWHWHITWPITNLGLSLGLQHLARRLLLLLLLLVVVGGVCKSLELKMKTRQARIINRLPHNKHQSAPNLMSHMHFSTLLTPGWVFVCSLAF